jgi:hypothetical protein
MKKFILSLVVFGFSRLILISQDFNLNDHPPVWDGKSLCNRISYLFPFPDSSTFSDAAIYFERKENSNIITMRYRVVSKYAIEDLYMNGPPQMMVKLGDGTILKSNEERVTNGVLNAQFIFDVYFILDNDLQQKIIKYGIDKVRIAYIYTYLGLHKNQIFDAFTKDFEEKNLNAGMFLIQVKNADLNKAKQEAQKSKLDYKF